MPAIVPVHVVIGPDALSTVKAAMPIVLATFPAEAPLLVPSTGETGDMLLNVMSDALRAVEVIPGVLVPADGPRALMRAAWTSVEISAPDLPRRRVRIASGLVGKAPWIICDVDAVAGTGPFVLDVVSRYLHPFDRLRLLADRERERAAADLNLAIRPAWNVIGGHAGAGYLIAATRDPVAAELFALAISEHKLGPEVGYTGPWEDPVVQRATELELGVVIPHQIALTVHGDPGDSGAVLARIADRIGVEF